MNTQRGIVSAMGLSVALLVGCGGGAADLPELGKVSGTVKVDGNPVAQVVVNFVPESGGRPSSGTTNDQGEYKLIYNSDNMGAVIGKQKVTVSNPPLDAPPAAGEDAPQGPIPAKYAGWSTEVEVKAGDNTIDLDVTGGK